jgi:hypothetical protein
MNINRVFKLVDTCAAVSKQNTLLLLTFEAEKKSEWRALCR